MPSPVQLTKLNPEEIIRPFQKEQLWTARVLAPRPPAPLPEEVSGDGVLEWRGSAQAKWVEEPSPMLMGFTTAWREDAAQRVTEEVRVENPDDPEQFVMVERT